MQDGRISLLSGRSRRDGLLKRGKIFQVLFVFKQRKFANVRQLHMFLVICQFICDTHTQTFTITWFPLNLTNEILYVQNYPTLSLTMFGIIPVLS